MVFGNKQKSYLLIVFVVFWQGCSDHIHLQPSEIKYVIEDALLNHVRGQFSKVVLDEIRITTKYCTECESYEESLAKLNINIGMISVVKNMYQSKELIRCNIILLGPDELIVSIDISYDCGEEVCGLIEHHNYKRQEGKWRYTTGLVVAET